MKTQEEFYQARRNAIHELKNHYHGKGTSDERESCSACTLNGYHPRGERRDFINNAGWARVYIQAGKFIPTNLQFQFLVELASDNRSYANALVQDIRDYGINCKKPSSFFNAIRDVLGIYD